MIKKIVTLVLTIGVMLGMSALDAGAYYELSLPDWTVSPANVTNYTDYYIYVDTKTKNSGKASLHMQYNLNLTSNRYVTLRLTGTNSLSSEKKYEFSYYHKGTANNKIYINWGGTRISSIGSVNVSDWTRETKTITPTTDGWNLQLILESRADYWIDDIELRELDENEQPIGENLVKNGDFESCPLEPVGEVSNVSVKPASGSLDVSWTNPEDEDFYGVSIYTIDENDEETFVMEDETGELTEYVIEGLENGVISRFKIKTVTKYGVESEGVFMFGTPTEDDVTVSNVVFGGEGNSKNVQLRVHNNSFGAQSDVMVLMVAYKDGAMVCMKKLSQPITLGEYEDYYLEMPDMPEGAQIELYLCDGLENLKPLTNIIYDK